MSSEPATMSGQAEPKTNGAGEEHGSNRLGWFLCWAVVFADLGTSVYYTPGILFGQVGKLAGLFVTMTLVVFLLLTLKYAEVSVRFPEGGGVVTVAARGLNPWAGAVGGMFILVDYFLTSAISSLSGLQYFTDVVPGIGPFVLPLTVVVVVALGVLNWWGIKESASVSAVIAVAALLSDAAILVLVFVHVPISELFSLVGQMFHGQNLGPGLLLTGYAGAFLAFSGLESISQLSPVMRAPRHKTVRAALTFVVITVGITSPLLTFFSTMLLNAEKTDPSKFISQLGGAYGGDALKVATAIAASALLVFASNTAIIGAYHVFLALSRMQFFPKVIEKRNAFRDTPHVAIAIATGIPILVLIAVSGQIQILGDMYAFGLLGAFSLTCIALDAMRMRERRSGVAFSAAAEDEAHALVARAHGIADEGEVPPGFEEWMSRASQHALSEGEFGQLAQRLARARRAARDNEGAVSRIYHLVWPHLKYYLGFITTFLVSIAWITNLFSKPLATAFGGTLTVVGVGIAVVNFRRQAAVGRKPVFPSRTYVPVPGALLVVLPSGNPENTAVVRAAIASSHGAPLAFLGLGTPYAVQTRTLMQITDAYFHDEDMKQLFGETEAACREAHVQAHFFYRIRGPVTVAAAWHAIQAAEVVVAADVSRTLPGLIQGAEYVRKQPYDGVLINHYLRPHASAMLRDTNGPQTNGRTPAVKAAERRLDGTNQNPTVTPTVDSAGEAPTAASPQTGGDDSLPRFKKVLLSNTRPGRPHAFTGVPREAMRSRGGARSTGQDGARLDETAENGATQSGAAQDGLGHHDEQPAASVPPKQTIEPTDEDVMAQPQETTDIPRISTDSSRMPPSPSRLEAERRMQRRGPGSARRRAQQLNRHRTPSGNETPS